MTWPTPTELEAGMKTLKRARREEEPALVAPGEPRRRLDPWLRTLQRDPEVMAVAELLRRIDGRGTDVRLDVGSCHRARVWPREAVNPARWRWRVAQSYGWKVSRHINVLELEADIAGGGATEFGITVCGTAGGEYRTVIGYDTVAGALKIDTIWSGDWQRVEKGVGGTPRAMVETAPMKLDSNESLKLRVFVDRCMIEVFANDGRLALSRVVYPPKDASCITLYAAGGPAVATSVRVWDLMPTNPY